MAEEPLRPATETATDAVVSEDRLRVAEAFVEQEEGGTSRHRGLLGHATTALLVAMSRGDLALLALLWGGNLALGRRALLDEEPDGTRFDERIFAGAGAIAGVLTLIFLFL